MRLEAGGSLDKLLHPSEGASIPLTTLDKLKLLSKIIRVLAELHECGCVHGDLVRRVLFIFVVFLQYSQFIIHLNTFF